MNFKSILCSRGSIVEVFVVEVCAGDVLSSNFLLGFCHRGFRSQGFAVEDFAGMISSSRFLLVRFSSVGCFVASIFC